MGFKKCTKCGETKPLSEFCKQSSLADGLATHCRICKGVAHNAWRVNNRERERFLGKRYYEANKDKVKAQAKAWQHANPEKIKARNARRYLRVKNHHRSLCKKWAQTNRARSRALCMQYYTGKIRAIPRWVNYGAVDAVYLGAAKWGFAVDHIVPLKSVLVCGLHCEANLQALHKSENSKKGNRWWPDMPD